MFFIGKILSFFDYKIKKNIKKNVDSYGSRLNAKRVRDNIYKSVLVNKFIEINNETRKNNKLTLVNKFQIFLIKLKYVASLNKIIISFKFKISIPLISYIIKIKKYLCGYNRKLKFNVVDESLTKDEIWATNYIKNNKKFNGNFFSLIKEKERKISKTFQNWVSYRDDETEKFDVEMKKCSNFCINEIRKSIKLDNYNTVFNLYRRKKRKFKINLIPRFVRVFIFKLSKEWENVKEKRADGILLNRKKRLDEIKFNAIKKEFGDVDNRILNCIHKGAKLNKAINDLYNYD